MARRVLEAELLAAVKGGLCEPMACPQGMKVVKEHHIHRSFNGVFSMQFNFTGDILAVGYGSGGIQLFDSATGTMQKELRACRQGGDAVMVLRWHPKEPHILYAGTTEGIIFIYNSETGEEVGKITETGNEINALDFCVDGYNFATGGKDLGIRIYETKKNVLVKTYEGIGRAKINVDKHKVGNTMRVFALKFHPNNQFVFVSGGWDNHLKIWDIRDNDGIKRNINGPHICGDSIDMMGNTILSGQWTALHSLQEFDYTSGKVNREIKFPHKEGAFIYAALYTSPGYVFAGGSGTNRGELIEIETGRHVGGCALQGPVQALDSANNGRVLAVGGAGQVFSILQPTEEAIQHK